MAAEVLRGRPVALRSDEGRGGEVVREVIACNRNPRYSLAGVMTAGQLRRAQAAPGVRKSVV